MKNLLLSLSISFTLITASAQNYRLWATYYGGSGQDNVKSITTDALGNVYMAGYTNSGNGIATVGSYQPNGAGSTDAYLVKFNGAGVRQWATYFGGPDVDLGYSVKTDASGNVYLAGYTYSTSGIASSTAYQTNLNGANTRDAFLAKFKPNGTLEWATYYGGESNDEGLCVTTDAAGNVYLGGETYSTMGIALTGEFQDTKGGGAFDNDGFLVKFNSSGARQWGTYYGGSGFEAINSVVTDLSGNLFICGSSTSTAGIASAGSFKPVLTGSPNAFLAKFNSTGTRSWGTYYGGSGPESGACIATDVSGNVFLVGTTLSATGIAFNGYQNTLSGGNTSDAFLVKFNSSGIPQWGTYYGGTGEDEGSSVATDATGNVFLNGGTYTTNNGNNISTQYGFQTALSGLENQFLAVFSPSGLRYAATYYGVLHEEEGVVAVNTFGDVYIAGDATSATGIASAGSHQSTYGGGNQDGYLVKFATAAPIIEVIVPNNNLPPSPTNIPPKIYTSIDIFNGGGISISNAVLKNFSPGSPLPASGSSTINFTCDFTASYNNGSSIVTVTCPATAKIKVDFSSATGPSAAYDAEMLQLDLSGGTLPPGVMLRESPTLTSAGVTAITDIGGGQFRLSSFFDVYTELSLDGGNSWQPNSNPSARLVLEESPASIPTLTEWGLISLCILILTMGIFYVRRLV